jgi:hypothetical protein
MPSDVINTENGARRQNNVPSYPLLGAGGMGGVSR